MADVARITMRKKNALEHPHFCPTLVFEGVPYLIKGATMHFIHGIMINPNIEIKRMKPTHKHNWR
jgi:hypothetical protein